MSIQVKGIKKYIFNFLYQIRENSLTNYFLRM
nr:MAG TPA: hypothetical protein [Caudoviricetes sp.]